MPHIHDKIDFTVETFIVCKERVLLRMHDKYGIWLGVGGHIELHEDPNEAVPREVGEEVGLECIIVPEKPLPNFNISQYKELIPPRALNRHRINENHEHVTLVYFARSTHDRVKQGETELSREIKWFTREELDDSSYGIREDVRHYAKMALEEIR